MVASVGLTPLILLILFSSKTVVAEVVLDIIGWWVVQLSYQVSTRFILFYHWNADIATPAVISAN
jgi:hypothetical protein